jgi:hypothetical protein
MLILQSPITTAQLNSSSENQVQANPQHNGWLGVTIRPMSRVLAMHLSELMPSGEGILVAEVENQSPAEKAGILSNDILLSLDGQKLYSPTQLSALVASSHIGKQVAIQLIRKGKLTTLKADIGQRPDRFQQPRRDFIPPMMRTPLQSHQPVPRPVPKLQQQSLAWDSFESVEVKTLEDGRYHATVSFKDQNNEVKNFTFIGKKEEIVKQINQQKDLPGEKREALLNALNMNQNKNFGPFNAPWMQGNPFNDPFFRNGPFDDSFLRDPFFNNAYPQFRSPFFDRFTHPQPPQQNWQYQR